MKYCGWSVTRVCRAGLLVIATALSGALQAAETARSAPAAALYARYQALLPQLENNHFGRAMQLESVQTDNSLTGAVSAVVQHPFAQVSNGLTLPTNWCKLLMLHINAQSCRIAAQPAGTMLVVGMGQKRAGPTAQVYPLEFDFRVVAASADYFEVRLSADQGPLATRDYRLNFAATRLDDSRSFLRLSYSYGFGLAGRLAMQGYLATTGRNKVGFTIDGSAADGSPKYIGGIRGVVERNAMRYYLAIDVHLDSYAVPAPQQFEYSINRWFEATERFARQLHELDRADYLAKKRGERETSPL